MGFNKVMNKIKLLGMAIGDLLMIWMMTIITMMIECLSSFVDFLDY